jgi:hypothetical protein
MTKHIGIVGGSSGGAALRYRTICLEAAGPVKPTLISGILMYNEIYPEFPR